MKTIFTLYLSLVFGVLSAQQVSTIKETTQAFKTYPFNDPNPIPSKTLIYPYFRFDGFTNEGVNKNWKVIELENPYIKVVVLPEVGGKIWGAWEKSTDLPFLYYNHVVKFRDVAMRGPWTSGGIEANYGIIGHTPNCATPVDYKTEKKPDGSVSCYIGTFDKLTQTYWTIEINLTPDKAYFTTRSTWHNGNGLEQPYYSWMNVGMPAKGNLEFIFPGTRYLGHEGEFANWKINLENNKDISLYQQNNFGGYKSYHVFGSYTDFFGAFYHDLNFGMAHYSLYDEKPGKKIWIWGLSRQGMIWENLLTDTDGQYVEIQSGRLFNQSSDGSMLTPFKNRGFAPYSTDSWTEYWFPAKGTSGMVKANPSGSLNLRAEGGYLKWVFSPLQKFTENVVIEENGKVLREVKTSFDVLRIYKDSTQWSGDITKITFKLGNRFFYDADPTTKTLSRPVSLPTDFQWDSPSGLYMLGKEASQGRDYEKAEGKFSEVLAKDPYHVSTLSEMAGLQIRKMNYEGARALALKALSIDTYEPSANFAYGLASVATNHNADAKDAFGIASASVEFRSASFSELSKLHMRQGLYDQAFEYAQKSIAANSLNLDALQLTAVVHRLKGDQIKAKQTLNGISQINPLSHYVDAENFLSESAKSFGESIQQEMKEEVFIDLADWYLNINRYSDALTILKQAPLQAEILFWQAYLMSKVGDPDYTKALTNAENASVKLVFPYRLTAAKVMNWAIQNSSSWKPKYFLALIQWNAGNVEDAKGLFQQCGDPDFAPFHAAKAALLKTNVEQSLRRAAQLDKGDWRYGRLLTNYFLDRGEGAAALATIQPYQKTFHNNDAISSLYAKCLLLNKQYEASYQFLMSKTFLPNEGSTEGHQLYREALLMMALDNLEKKKYDLALRSLEKAKQWPESLGAGKPYDSDLDERLERFIEALCLENQGNKKAADKIFSELMSEKLELMNANLIANALALRRSGKEASGLALLEDWKKKTPFPVTATWCIDLFKNNESKIPAPSIDAGRLYSRLIDYLKK